MDRFPALRLILRYGRIGTAVFAVLMTLCAVGVLWPFIGWPSILIALFIGAVAYLLAKSYVEIIQIVIEMVH